MTNRIKRTERKLRPLLLLCALALLIWLLTPLLLSALINKADLRKALDQFIAPTERSLNYEPEIRASLFPSPTIRLRDVTVSEPNQPSRTVIKAADLSLRFNWQSLFQTPEVTRIIMSGITVDASRDEQGHWSVQDLLNLGSTQPSRLSVLSTLRIGNAQLNLVDEGLQKNYQIDQFSLDAAGLQGNAGQLALAGKFIQEGRDLAFQAQTDTQKQAPQYALNNLLVNAQLLNDDGIIDANIRLLAKGLWHPDEGTLDLNSADMVIESHQGRANTNLHIAQWHMTPAQMLIPSIAVNAHLTQDSLNQLDVTGLVSNVSFFGNLLQVEDSSFQAEYKRLQKTLLMTARASMTANTDRQFQINDLSFSSREQNATDNSQRWRTFLQGDAKGVFGDHAELSSSGTFDDSPLALDLNYQAQRADKIQLRLDLERFNAGNYVSLPSIGSASADAYLPLFDDDTPFDFSWLDQLNISGDVAISKIQLGTLLFNQVSTHIQAEPKLLTLQDVHARLYEGDLMGSLQLDTSTTPKLTINQSIKGMSVHAWLNDLFGYDRLSGTGDTDLSLETQGNSAKKMRERLNGTLHIALNQGKLHGIDFLELIQQISRQENLTTPMALDVDQQSDTPFQSFQANIQLKNGVANNQNFSLVSPFITLKGKGSLDLNKQDLNYQLHVQGRASAPLKYRKLNIPLNITGPIKAPSYAIDYKTLVQNEDTPEARQKALQKELANQFSQWFAPPKP
ncbi:MAG: AsmA family protein [Neisseriaceae bacterium]|nr:AsmA family protein [Neisseriaceae bacterium]MBP6860857.1 AsmA family protein [Neisseriaceae bacterium]